MLIKQQVVIVTPPLKHFLCLTLPDVCDFRILTIWPRPIITQIAMTTGLLRE